MYPMSYIEPVFRPPSEWKSLILQVTNGCSWNKCTFCDMYTEPQKRFQPQDLSEIEAQLRNIVEAGYPVYRVFLADGDAMTLSTRRLNDILDLLNRWLPHKPRVSAYCLPRNLRNKTVDDLQVLRSKGLSLLYVGCETGDNELLTLISKGESFDSSLDALQKMHAAGIKSSVMVLNGLGGPELSERHALESARLMNAAQPHYLSTLVVEFPRGTQRFNDPFKGRWRKLAKLELFREMETFLRALELKNTIFRSDHASNYLVLKGVLGKDKNELLQHVRTAINQPGRIPLREEWQRGL
ncbi:B12-binding domain-containing radical SAM protein [Gammaproteobacteria bacterium LSUCC0112]|nr:B12-binding domain-containing radical SAM protein [Gammaproteobacteria bacterium LSUCC0112]